VPMAQNSRPGTPREDGGRKGKRIGIGEDDGDGGLANRWGLRGKKGKSMQDNPLMAGFGRLRRELGGCKGLFSPQYYNTIILYKQERKGGKC
jgi:golgi-specific brefeldin A-resistance guanine nucleotide exchange factor 1